MATSFMNFDKKYSVCGSSKLKATVAGHIFNILVSDEVLENGAIVSKGAYVEPEVYEQGAEVSAFEGLVVDKAANGNYYVEVKAVDGELLVLQVPMMYENYTSMMKHESNFFNVKGDIVRAYELYLNDIFELSKEGFTGEIAVGDTVKVDSDTKKLIKA